MKEGVVKKVKQDDTQTAGVQQPHSNGVDKAASETKSMEVERYDFVSYLPNNAL